MSLKKLVLQTTERRFRNYVKKIYVLEREEVHKKTGALFDSISIEWNGRHHAKVGVDVAKLIADSRNVGRIDYSTFYYYGSKPHIIEASPGKTLHWTKNGKDYFAKKVRHPGYKGDKFIERVIAKRPKI